ncbi:aminoglycoside phosphotransferase family protein [Arthrobacter zhaoxinii]|uniref:Aminoglycoside phosphotransferase family protein n=1 Tax=Arthrobacter zhaoxinii TaxID=2964616 RepID=A0ABY5YSG0_9MICC|nr:aminoglycoside phosphotransferase family protein [Arthrobacter zhaoxinii]UWX98035.1 aminoglycoside phosphotransferase family protein [Arthrobacter zhaoxinii]
METWHRNRLSARQAELVEAWLPGVRLVADLSWNLLDTAVLEVADAAERQRRYVVKAAGPSNHHIGREIDAHESWISVWSRQNRAPKLVHADRSENILVTEYLEGSLVEGTEAEYDPGTYQQAGCLLRIFHEQSARTDADYESRATAKALLWLERPHRISESHVARVRAILDGYRPKPVVLVPTHGDWQPRNWLMDGSELRVIDFGRYDFRPALTDLCRLAAQQWRPRSYLEAAFFEGYGTDFRDTELWNVALLREAVSTAAWAYQVGDPKFEEQGHRMLRDALGNFA